MKSDVRVYHARSNQSLTTAGLPQSVERLTEEREVAGSIPGAGTTQGLKITEK